MSKPEMSQPLTTGLSRPQTAAATDPVALLLADKRSPATKRAYRADLRDFFGGDPRDPLQAEVAAFLALPPQDVALRLAKYKASLLDRKLSEATVNRRLAAVRSLLKFSHRLGLSQTDGRGLVDGERAQAYRDTRGVDRKTIGRLLALPAQIHGGATLRALRDAALLRLLCENALRRAEVCALNVSDFSPTELRLSVLGKGRGSQKAPVTLTPRCAQAVAAYLAAAGHAGDDGGALFRNVDRRYTKRSRDRQYLRLTIDGLYHLVRLYGREIGIELAPHKLRHSAITALLDATGGDVRTAQRLSRHSDVRTLQRYDDNREDLQGKASQILSDLF
jgi:integrase/recombinase XerC